MSACGRFGDGSVSRLDQRVASVWRQLKSAAPVAAFCVLVASLAGAQETSVEDARSTLAADGASREPFAVVLGIAQDGGFPQAGCGRECCREAWVRPELRRSVSCLAIVDPATRQRWMLDCTPDFRQQLFDLEQIQPRGPERLMDGILLTHAHMGHYAGLIHLGREAIGASAVPVFAMPRMKRFLEQNGPWDQLVQLKNVELRELEPDREFPLNGSIGVTPIRVPHRDEYSETVAFLVAGPNRKLLYLPDIDQWSRWDRRIEELIENVDVALLDGTFFAAGELPGRDLEEIPHPLVSGSLARFSAMEPEMRKRIHFFHLNHSNPLLGEGSPERRAVEQSGMHVARELHRFGL